MTNNVRAIEVGRGLWAAALLVATRAVLQNVHHLEVDDKSVVIARILGARHLTQAALSGIRPSPEVLAMGVWVDVVHAISAVGLAAADRSRARAGLIDAVFASVWAAAGYRDLSGGGATPSAHDRRRDALANFVLRTAPGGKPLLVRSQRDRQQARPT